MYTRGYLTHHLQDGGGAPGNQAAGAQWLSSSDRARIPIARELIYNPEVLLVHKRNLMFPEEESKQVMAMLSEHVAA